MKKEIEIYDKGLEEYPKSNVVISNFLMSLWIALGNYYDKWCNTGLGKLCALLFKRGDIEKFGISSLKLAPFTYGLLTLIPLISVLASIILQFTIFKIAVLIPLLLISFYNGAIGRKRACTNCKIRLICPGSAVR